MRPGLTTPRCSTSSRFRRLRDRLFTSTDFQTLSKTSEDARSVPETSDNFPPTSSRIRPRSPNAFEGHIPLSETLKHVRRLPKPSGLFRGFPTSFTVISKRFQWPSSTAANFQTLPKPSKCVRPLPGTLNLFQRPPAASRQQRRSSSRAVGDRQRD